MRIWGNLADEVPAAAERPFPQFLGSKAENIHNAQHNTQRPETRKKC